MSDGDVPKQHVIRVFEAHGVSCYPQAEDPSMTVITDGKGTTDAYALMDPIGRRMVCKLAHKFGVPIHLIHNPHLLPPPPDRKRP